MNPTSLQPSLSQFYFFPETIASKKTALTQVSKSVIQWVRIAKEKEVDIKQDVMQLQRTMENDQSIIDLHTDIDMGNFITEQISSRTLYCIQIIRKIAIECINRKLNKLELNGTKPETIKIYKQRVVELLPPENDDTISLTYVESIFKEIIETLREMKKRQALSVSPNILFSKATILNSVSEAIDKWINVAHEENIDILDLLLKLQEIMEQTPSIQDLDNNKAREFILAQQICFKSFYCIRIIRRVAFNHIALGLNEMKEKTTNQPLLALYKIALDKLIPAKDTLSIIVAEHSLEKIKELFKEMSKAIEQDNQGINLINGNNSNGCI